MTHARIVLLLVLVAGGAAVYVSLPPQPRRLPPAGATLAAGVRGAIHVHTERSDGSGTADEIAAAAARAGLQFVILTDHADAASEPTTPTYRAGVLCIDAVEISTDGGHVVALGLARAPYPLAGEPRDVLEDIARLGGMAIVAHPGSEKPALRWAEWSAPFDGLEWLNGDSEWRDESPAAFTRALISYPFRPVATLAALLDRPEDVLRRWDELTARRQVVAVAAGDAHARLALRDRQEPYEDSLSLHVPAYEQVFRTFSITVTPLALAGDAAADARAVLDAIRRGHVYSSIDGLAGPVAMSFSATSDRGAAVAGDVLPAGGPVTLQVDSNAPPDARLTLVKNGTPLSVASGASLRQTVTGEAAVYRVEMHLPDGPGTPPVPWVVSNPIYVRSASSGTTLPDPRPRPTAFATDDDNGSATAWKLETREGSLAALDVVPAVGGSQVSLRWGLGGTLSQAPYVALVMPAGETLSKHDRLMFTGRAARPMRLSVQLRVPQAGDGERWQRSIYIDETPREVTIFFDDMSRRGTTAQPRPVLSDVRDILFVVDTLNTKPGTSGQLWIDDVRYAR
jgi:hypothetical protein